VESHGNSDLVTFLFRRAFELLQEYGTMGLIATNTIAQGDMRSTEIRFICNNGGMIYNETRRYKWPGIATVIDYESRVIERCKNGDCKKYQRIKHHCQILIFKSERYFNSE
jgi:hypothetical protein